MDQLKGKIVNVVLTVQEGRGLEAVRNQIHISANFNGRVLDSDPVAAVDSPLFGTNLIWEIEKRDLRKIRSGNQPLRVECCGLDQQGRRDKFGHLLLDLRSAQIVCDAAEDKVTYKWHKLVGVRNKRRNTSPELYLALALANHQPRDEDNTTTTTSLPIQHLLMNTDDAAAGGGFVQIGGGDAADCDQHFNLQVLIESASNLDLLLPEVLVFNQTKHRYCLSLKIPNHVAIKTQVFSRDLHETIGIEEKIVVRIRSNRANLEKFFADTRIEIGFLSGDDLLGVAVLRFDSLFNFETLKLTNQTFKFPSTNGIVPTSVDGRQPAVSLQVFLEANPSEKSDEKLQLDDWKLVEMAEFSQNLERLKIEEMSNVHRENESKRRDLDENLQKCKHLQTELESKLDQLNKSKSLARLMMRNKKSGGDICGRHLAASHDDNSDKYENCDPDLLIEYVTRLERDNDELKNAVEQQKRELENFQRTALTKEQTCVLLQELKGLEEKFEVAQQAKSYFKEQWKLACDEIHELKNDEFRQIQHQIEERRQELQDQFHFIKHDDEQQQRFY